ncbi:uncharacterized protein LOC124354355 [Homalodisca vitripennis]|uniref:uncharacterized protein LOC124354355 n=1 Tax=Homalodisca vitripennis TaxID=197043 RepID=UPI001EEC3A7D|nr:uncharacterized protein LOC124354355 [Homalodisca vitripennis]
MVPRLSRYQPIQHLHVQCSGNGPTPLSLQRLASCLQSVVSLLECPVCLETIPPPAFQCCNGHTLCGVCRSLTDRCPVCRVALGPRGRCLLADKLHMLFAATFLQSGGKKQKRSKAWTRQQLPTLHLPSRLLPRIVPTPSVERTPRPTQQLYNCPLDSCGSVVKSCDLLSHLQHHGDGPLVQYFCKESSTFLRFPVTRLTTITLSQTLTFVLHVTPHPVASCLLLWLWIASEDASSYRLQLELPGRAAVRGQVFPLSWTSQQVLALAADKCVVLNDDDFDANCSKVKVTILSKCDSTTI